MIFSGDSLLRMSNFWILLFKLCTFVVVIFPFRKACIYLTVFINSIFSPSCNHYCSLICSISTIEKWFIKIEKMSRLFLAPLWVHLDVDYLGYKAKYLPKNTKIFLFCAWTRSVSHKRAHIACVSLFMNAVLFTHIIDSAESVFHLCFHHSGLGVQFN